MALAWFYNGPCYVQVGTLAGHTLLAAMETLGVSLKGATITPEFRRREQESDAAGQGGIADIQAMNEIHRVEVELASFDKAVMTKLNKLACGGTVEGQMPAPGQFLGAGGFSHQLYLPANGGSEDPWYWPNAILERPSSNFGTSATNPKLSFLCWALLGPADTTVSGKVLYTRAAPGAGT